MRASLRFKTILLAGGLALAPASALAQNTTTAQPAPVNAPATDAVGPRELQNFSLPGTSTQPRGQSATPPPANDQQPPARADASSGDTAPPAATPSHRLVPNHQTVREKVTAAPDVAPSPAAESSVLPPPSAAPATTAQAPSFTSRALPEAETSAPAVAGNGKLWLLPWLIAALALAGATAFLLWRRRPRLGYADGPHIDLFAAPEPAPAPPRPAAAPRPAPAPPPAQPKPTPVANGIVAARLRPSLEIGVKPLRCLVEDAQVTIEFEIELFNSGTAPARAVLAEASLLNAGATQDQDLAAFFSNPVGAGERLDAIPPLKRITLTSQVVAPRAAVQEYELAGRKAFVPVIAFNALYEWSGGKGQTSAAYLLGRETKGDKLGPLRLDLGPRDFRGLGARPLPTTLRT